jgi:hypothetical protein
LFPHTFGDLGRARFWDLLISRSFITSPLFTTTFFDLSFDV